MDPHCIHIINHNQQSCHEAVYKGIKIVRYHEHNQNNIYNIKSFKREHHIHQSHVSKYFILIYHYYLYIYAGTFKF